MSQNKFPKYIPESAGLSIPSVFLSDDVYEQALRSFIIVCTDAVIINKERKTLYLAKRKHKPRSDVWFIGGRRFAGEKVDESIVRCFKRETNLLIAPDRFSPVTVFDYLWKDREQVPQEAGCHVIAYTFSIELSEKEISIASSSLDNEEYDPDFGLQEFNREKILALPNPHEALLCVYDQIFSV